jgi:hypothetical protein
VTVGDDVGIAFSIAADGTTSLLSLELHAPAPSADGAASADRKAAIAECANAAATPHGKP